MSQEEEGGGGRRRGREGGEGDRQTELSAGLEFVGEFLVSQSPEFWAIPVD